MDGLSSISANDIAVGGLRAQRARMNLIANNIANVQTTRTPEGGPFRRQLAVLRGEQIAPLLRPSDFGVQVLGVESDPTPFREVFEPGHPDADENGMVQYPNVNISVEMIDLLSAQRAYEANIDVMLSSRRMAEKALEIIRA